MQRELRGSQHERHQRDWQRGEHKTKDAAEMGRPRSTWDFGFNFEEDGGSATEGPTGTQNCCKHAVRVRVAVALGKQRNQKQHGIVTKLPHANHNPQVRSPNFIRLFLEQKHSNISRTEMMMSFPFGM